MVEPDLADPAVARWPAFARAAADAGVLAVFAFPLHLGAIRLGVLVLYRDRRGVLSADETAYDLVLADVATHVLLALQAGAPPDALHEVLASESSHWAEVHQATGMASSSERSDALDLLQSQNEEGPCFECYLRGRPVFSEDLTGDSGHWPTFAPMALQEGFCSVQAILMRADA